MFKRNFVAVGVHSANSLQLANAIRLGNIAQALEFVEHLINCNEPALKITAIYSTRLNYLILWVGV